MHVRPVLCPVVVGRDDELGFLREALDSAREGRGGTILISGEAGIGKTRLARWTEELAAERGMVVLRGRGSPEEGSRPFGPLTHALHSSPEANRLSVNPELEPYRAALAHLLPLWGTGPAAPEARLLLPTATRRLLRHLADDRGLLLVVEDAQWADDDTVALLDRVADDLAFERVLCLITERSDTPGPAAEILAGMAERRAAVRIALAPLSEDDVARMARLALDTEELPASLLSVLRGRAEGVPFLVEEMLGAFAAAAGRVGPGVEWWLSRRVADDLPRSYRDLVRQRLSSLKDADRRVVFAGAMLGRTFDWSLLGRIAGVAEPEVLPALGEATEAQLIGSPRHGDLASFAFRHALARESVLAELLPPEIAVLAQKAAEVLEDAYPGLPGEWCDRAASLRIQAGDGLGASRLLLESARRAFRHGALATAESSLLRALDLVEGDYMAWAGPAELLVAVWSASGKIDRLVDLARSLPEFFSRYNLHEPGVFSAGRVAQLHLAVVRAALVSDRPDLADHHLSMAREATSRALVDEGIELELRATEARLALARGSPSRARAIAASVVGAGEAAAVSSETVVDALETVGRAALAEGDLAEAKDAFSHAEARAREAGSIGARLVGLIELATIDHLTGSGTDRLEECRRIATGAGAVSALARIDLEVAWSHLAQADRNAAGVAIDRALDLTRTHGLGLLPHLLIAEAHRRGLAQDAAGVEDVVAEAVMASPGDQAIRSAAVGNGPAVILVLEGRLNEALTLLTEAGTAVPHGTPSAWWFPGLATLLQEALGEEGLMLPVPAHPANRGYIAFARAIARGRDGRGPDAARAFARGELEMPTGWQRHHARVLVAEAAVRDGWGDPGRWATEALAWAEQVSLEPLAAAARRVMRRAGARVGRRGRGTAIVPGDLLVRGVTSREMDVLLQVAEGRSNQEIAQRLFISPRTVESHIESLMRKCPARTRAELVAFAAASTRGPSRDRSP